jgi:hypothetical protein
LAKRFTNLVVSVEKLRDYCLSETHPRGRHKARVFKSRLGLGPDDAGRLAQVLTEAATERQHALQDGDSDAFGDRYILDVPITTDAGSATIRSAWIVRNGDGVLRFVTCFVL